MSDHGWESVTLGEVTAESRIRAGNNPELLERPVYGVNRSIGLTSVAKYTASNLERYKIVEHGMFAYNPMRLNIGSIGFCTQNIEPGLVSPDYVVFECNPKKLDPNFLSYYINSPAWKEWTANAGVGSVRMRIYYKEIARLPLRLPPLREQRAIAEVLSVLDDKIELNRRMSSTLESMAGAVFREMMKNEDKRKNRRQATISEVVTVVGGSTPSTSNLAFWEDGSFHWATPKDLADLQSPILLDTNSRITELGLQQISSGLLPIGTVLLSSRAPIGYLAITQLPVAINQGFIAIKCTEEVPNYFILNWLKENMEEIINRANGTTFLEITKSNFRPMTIVVPSPEKIKEFVQIVEPLYQKIIANLKESHTLASLRDTLLPRLMRGEVRLKDVDK